MIILHHLILFFDYFQFFRIILIILYHSIITDKKRAADGFPLLLAFCAYPWVFFR